MKNEMRVLRGTANWCNFAYVSCAHERKCLVHSQKSLVEFDWGGVWPDLVVEWWAGR